MKPFRIFLILCCLLLLNGCQNQQQPQQQQTEPVDLSMTIRRSPYPGRTTFVGSDRFI